MTDTLSAESYQSRYDIEKFHDHNYHTWSFQCQMLLSEKKVWNIVEDKTPRSKSIDEYTTKEQVIMNATAKQNIEKIIVEWDEKNNEVLHIISFMIVECLQGFILYDKNAKGAWDELQRIHASRDR